ncbi:hypothetical protein [Nocardiopsis composta]|uniref:Uncharacterized protein n=1 Tax=Nocardiopsis composta TaxID=157465 RepID=A0A7W8QJD7_9ACTN|nr:hypothetical protein [Nocardiopsis composta]MBB5431345.1 hypothetical protein [Nocardiopsis composta]
MALPFTTHQLVFLRPPRAPDAHGNRSRRTKNWSQAFRSEPVPGVVQPDAATLGASLATRESKAGGGEQVETTMRIWVDESPRIAWIDPPAGSDVEPVLKSTDGVLIDGQVYDIHGDPLVMADPLAGLGHTVMKAVEVRG